MRATRPVSTRFWEKVEKDPEGCWVWTAATAGDRGVYGKFHATPEKCVRSHRWAYEESYGPIPDGLVIDHLCRNPTCVRPDHLEAVSQAENVQRGSRTKRTHCFRGHPVNDETTAIGPSGRICRVCRRERERERYHKLKSVRK